MKKITLLACIISLSLIGCMPSKMIPLQGKYLETPYQTVSENKFEVVWDKIIDFFAQNGLSIRIIDKTSGLIVSNETNLPYTHESKNHEPIKKTAWIVLPSAETPNYTSDPTSVTGEWNIRIKSLEDGKTNINVNVVNITGYSTGYVYQRGVQTSATKLPDAKSTGVFEQMIADIIK